MSRTKQRENKKMKIAEEKIEKRTGTWNDPTPYLALKNIVRQQNRGETDKYRSD